jgi:cyclopropane fatty-acyl-phospholipid synthase-like methyltransferase
MSRIFSKASDKDQPRIDRESVVEFFEQRAKKADKLGYKQAVIYQDKHPDLAEQRDAAEKHLLTPKLGLTGRERILDVGCGTGRWADVLADGAAWYRGVDVSPGLIEIARSRFPDRTNLAFSVLPVDQVSLSALGESEPFDRVCGFGILIYLNDPEVDDAFRGVVDVTADGARLLLREPVGLERRLTIKEHFSDEMEQTYNAIYRTEEELMARAESILYPAGFALVDSGDVYADAQLNNRAETRQRWFLFERGV